MSEFLFYYQPIEPATWFYLSSLLMIGLFFKFGRLWSVRNLDLLLLILLAPGLLFIHYGRRLDERLLEGTELTAVSPTLLESGAMSARIRLDRVGREP